MEHQKTTTLLLWSTVLFGLIAGATLGIGIAAGQEDTLTATPAPGNETTYVGEVDPALRIVDYSTNGDGELVIVFEADVPRTVTISEAVTDGSGGQTFTIRRVNLPSGRTEVTFPATAASITTRQSIERGEGFHIDAGSGPLIGGPWSAQDVQLAAATAATTVGGITLLLTLLAVTGRLHTPERLA